MSIQQKLPWKMYPINKSNTGKYSYYKSSPIITFEFNETAARLIPSASMYLCGKFKLVNTGSKDQQPANRFDLVGSKEASEHSYEQVAYIDDRIAINSIIDTISVSSMRGNMYEQAANYHRNLASSIASTVSYKDLCSYQNMSMSSCANNDVIARECSGPMEFCLPLKNGYFTSNPLLSLERGLSLKINLAPDSQVIYGLNGESYKYELESVFLMGDYLILAEEIKGLDASYTSFYNFMGVMQSNNDHNNINMNLQFVNTLFHNFIPSDWSNNNSYNSFSTCPLLNYTDDYKVANIKQYTINRGAISYPNNYSVDEAKLNKTDSFQALRSRQYLDSLYPFALNKKCLISPTSENLTYMIDGRISDLTTPQTVDQGLVKSWKKDSVTGVWSRAGNIEKAAHVYGIGVRLDGLFEGSSSNYTQASYNYNIESDLDNKTSNVYIYALATTELAVDKLGNVIAVN